MSSGLAALTSSLVILCTAWFTNCPPSVSPSHFLHSWAPQSTPSTFSACSLHYISNLFLNPPNVLHILSSWFGLPSQLIKVLSPSSVSKYLAWINQTAFLAVSHTTWAVFSQSQTSYSKHWIAKQKITIKEVVNKLKVQQYHNLLC